MKAKVPVRAVIEMRTADARSPVPGGPGPLGAREALWRAMRAWHATRLARVVRLVLWTAVSLRLASGGLAYGCAVTEAAPPVAVAASLCPGHTPAGLVGTEPPAVAGPGRTA